MHLTTRRAAVVGAMAAATLAVAVTERKLRDNDRPSGPVMLRLDAEHAPSLRNLADAVQPADPPKPVAEIRFTAADGSGRTLADFAGKGVVLNLWATWCAPCGAELPSLDALAGRLAAENIVVLPLSSDRGGADTVAQYYKSHAIAHLGVWIDPDGAAMHALDARGIPTTLIVDRQGRERARLEGGIDWGSQNAAAVIERLVG